MKRHRRVRNEQLHRHVFLTITNQLTVYVSHEVHWCRTDIRGNISSPNWIVYLMSRLYINLKITLPTLTLLIFTSNGQPHIHVCATSFGGQTRNADRCAECNLKPPRLVRSGYRRNGCLHRPGNFETISTTTMIVCQRCVPRASFPKQALGHDHIGSNTAFSVNTNMLDRLQFPHAAKRTTTRVDTFEQNQQTQQH